MNPIVILLIYALQVYLYLIIASVIMSWLIAFDVLNTRNRWVYKICSLIGRATNPGMAYVRRFLPPMGGIDLSPMVLIFGIYLLQSFLYGLR